MEAGALLKELKRQIVELAAFHDIGTALTSTLELKIVLQLIMEKVASLLAPSHWSLLLADERTAELAFELAVGPGAEQLRGQRLAAGEGIAGHAARTGVPVRVSDVRGDPRFSARFDHQGAFETRSVLAVPLEARGRVLGVIELVNGPGERCFTPEDARTLGTLADYAAIAIENARNFARVQELTLIDEHTTLFNARHLRQVLAAECVRAERFRHPLSLVFFDLDWLKQINDVHGHLAGSAVLREVGERLRGHLRPTDVATRYGGDEYAVVLPETGPDVALQAASSWQVAFREAPFDAGGRGLALRVTASFGVATYPEHGTSAEALIEAADAAMYRVKARGRDGVEAARAVS